MTSNNQIMIPPGFAQGKVSTVLAGVGQDEQLGSGIRSSFGIIGYRGKVWSTKWQGEEKPIMREDGDGPRSSIEVVIVKASPSISKIYYEGGFVDGSTSPPDCWSTNGTTPDAAAPRKQSPMCAGCPKNAWGSKITDAGKQSKACADSKRLAVVPLSDMKNELMGGPMLLRVPAASLKDLKTFGDTLQTYGYNYFSVAVRIGFDIQEAYPKFVFTAIRPLTDDEATLVVQHREGAQLKAILNEAVEIVHHEPAVAIPSSPFEQHPAPAAQAATPAAQAQAPVASTQPAAQAAAPAAPVTPQVTPTAAPQEVPAKRHRRTKAEMEAAAAALRAKDAAPAQPATQATAPAAPAAPVQAPGDTDPAGDNFEDKLDQLLPVG